MTIKLAVAGVRHPHINTILAEAESRRDVELVGIAERDQELRSGYAERYDAPAYEDHTQLLDAVSADVIAIGDVFGDRGPIAVDALSAGAHVLSDKPLCTAGTDLNAIHEAWRRSGRMLSVAFEKRFYPPTIAVSELLRNGELGELALITATGPHKLTRHNRPAWIALCLGIHHIDVMLALMGPWRRVSAMAARLARDIETDDVSIAIVEFANGALATVVNSALSPREVSHLRIDTSRATIEVSHLYGYSNADWTYTPAPQVAPEVAAKWPPDVDEPSGHLAQLRELVADIRAGRRPETSGAGGRAALELITAMYKSAFTGQLVDQGSIGPSDPFYTSLHGEAQSHGPEIGRNP
ncbi:Gfo/Idh/MocA family protein [Nonomuraea sp. 3N208]|uniref:Gfo/Idh/MocA family protein n=1 Tax=Nonomuraea sp. 3N208 TaxID=3457421 RepID=UPI003FCFC242